MTDVRVSMPMPWRGVDFLERAFFLEQCLARACDVPGLDVTSQLNRMSRSRLPQGLKPDGY
jgi:hypothetical protein